MKKTRAIRYAALAVAVSTLGACGGGGSDSPSAPDTAAQQVKVKVKMTSLGISAHDVLAVTDAKTATASARTLRRAERASSMPRSSAKAAGLPSLDVGPNIGFTNKIVDGQLASLNAQLAAADGNSIPCDTSNAEVKVNAIWSVNAIHGDLLANITVPDTIDSTTCAVTYKTTDFVIAGTGSTYEIPANTGQVVDIVAAGDEGFNTSDTGLLIYSSGQVRTLDVPANGGQPTLTDLTSLDAAVLTSIGQFAYNGTYLVGTAADPAFTGVLVYQKDSTAFKMIRGGQSKYFGIVLNSDGQFLWNLINDLEVVDPVAGTATPAPTLSLPPFVPDIGYPGFGPYSWFPLYGARGRSGDIIMSDRCTLWNMKTGEVTYLQDLNNQAAAGTSTYIANNTDYARLAGGQAYCVNASMNLFVRYDVQGKTATIFNTDALGYFPKAFTMYTDYAMVEVVNSANSDKLYVELNFATGQAINRGVISTGDRQVVNLLPIGG
jgi:hypothetical protein